MVSELNSISIKSCQILRTMLYISGIMKLIDSISRLIFPSSKRSIPSQDHWWTSFKNDPQYRRFKDSYKNIVSNPMYLHGESMLLQMDYNRAEPPLRLAGKLHCVPGEFGLWLPGVALVASYLSEKKNVQGLYVCKSLEALASKLNEIALSNIDCRKAFVVGTQPSDMFVEPNYPQHKVAVCVEKKENQLTVVLLDAMPSHTNREIRPGQITQELWKGLGAQNVFNCQELVLRAILSGCRGSSSRILHSKVIREINYGCVVFALHDAVTFLQDTQFLNRIRCSENVVRVDPHQSIEVIVRLPPEFMIGTQSLTAIDAYRDEIGPEKFDAPLIGRKKTLNGYLSKYVIDIWRSRQNHYASQKAFKYTHLVVSSLHNLETSKIQELIDRSLL